jgi:hypothetical protein
MVNKYKSRTHLIIPDVQTKPGVDQSHLSWIGQFIVDKQPDVIIQIGDFADMPSLSSYDKGKKSFEGRRYSDDIKAVHTGMELLLNPMKDLNKLLARKKEAQYKPRMILTLGNHEDRITRAIDSDSKLEGTLSLSDLGYEGFGWEVYPFLKPVSIDGVSYCHYFTSGVMGKPVSSARALVKSRHCSAVMGHVQTTDIYCGDTKADGKQITGLFCGICYLHDEPYLGPQGNATRRQIVMLHEVDDGEFDIMVVSLKYLERKYGNK